MLKDNREGTSLAFKTFVAADGTRFLDFRSLEGSFHIFAEMEAKLAARDCGAEEFGNTRQMWDSLWEKQA
jgi:hypothetical protein